MSRLKITCVLLIVSACLCGPVMAAKPEGCETWQTVTDRLAALHGPRLSWAGHAGELVVTNGKAEWFPTTIITYVEGSKNGHRHHFSDGCRFEVEVVPALEAIRIIQRGQSISLTRTD
ncbi:MAG: hypothetical protein AAGI12_08055 [Pseudomonadota bacterium]